MKAAGSPTTCFRNKYLVEREERKSSQRPSSRHRANASESSEKNTRVPITALFGQRCKRIDRVLIILTKAPTMLAFVSNAASPYCIHFRLLLFFFVLFHLAEVEPTRRHLQPTMRPLQQAVKCTCGAVKFSINSPSALRMVCYCKDCRGYYNTLNANAKLAGKDPVAPLDNWGGVDWTQLYANEIDVLEGSDKLEVRVLHKGSQMHRVYTTCCYTPMFSLGQGTGSALVNTNLLDEDKKPDVLFRVIGRQALKGENMPSISWSVPLSFPFTMWKRIHKDQATPAPVVTPKELKILENFKEG